MIRELVARAMPACTVCDVAPLGRGLDHVAHLVRLDDGSELVVRVASAAGEHLVREAGLLAHVRGVVALPVPEIVWVDAEVGACAYPLLPGTPLLGRVVGDARAVGEALGSFVGALAAVPRDAVDAWVDVDAHPLPAWRAEAAEVFAEVRGELTGDERALVSRFLAEPLPRRARELVLCHHDLGAEHLLADASATRLTGVLDWGDAAIGDLAHDVGLVWRDLGDLVTVHLVGALGRAWTSDDAARATFHARCALLEDLAYGLAHGSPAHLANARANLARVFA